MESICSNLKRLNACNLEQLSLNVEIFSILSFFGFIFIRSICSGLTFFFF